MNLYANLYDLKSWLCLTGTSDDALLLAILEAVSREADAYCGRHFFTETATRYFDGSRGTTLLIDDVLSVSALTTDSELDNTFDGETWVAASDYVLGPDNTWPRWKVFSLIGVGGDYAWLPLQRYVKIVGTWGYGAGRNADPWTATAITGTVADTTGTSLTLSAAGTVRAGHTIKIGTEQLYVSAVSTTTATVTRGVNGTTAAAHTAVAISLAEYPANLEQSVTWFAAETYKNRAYAGFVAESVGEHRVQLQAPQQMLEQQFRLLGSLRRVTV